MTAPAIHIENLGFHYPGQKEFFFDDLSLTIAQGERFGLFGPNGAGKTTLMKLMTGLLSFVPQEFSFYEELTPVENLAFFGAWSGLNRSVIKTRTNELLDLLELTGVKDKQVVKFSSGMKRKVNLAIGVIHNPGILFLDEPTVGVDVQTRFAIIKYLKELNQNGTTLVYTSHQLSEAEGLCEKIALIDEGKIIAQDDLDKLLSDYREEGLEGLFLRLTSKEYQHI